MKLVNCNNTYELTDKMLCCLSMSENEFPQICAFGKYAVIKELLANLIRNGIDISHGIDLEDYEAQHYDKEYVLYLDHFGVTVEKMWHEDNEWHKAGYYDTDCDVAFVHEDCNSKILNSIESNKILGFDLSESDLSDNCATAEESNCLTVTIKCNLDAEEAMNTINEMEKRICHIEEIFDDINKLSALF
ncbi:MAG: hypothetical protein E6357_21030 [Clostridiales bacterium]|nr:hypothetical protein [Clostridiales bacterium]